MATQTSGTQTTNTLSNAINHPNIPILMQFITLAGPYFLVFFFVLASILDSNISGFVYLFGCIVTYGIITIFKETFPNKSKDKAVLCSLLEKFHGDHPSYVTAIYIYTLVYILIPMMMNNTFNLLLITLLLVIILVDFIIRVNILQCMPYRYIFLGAVIGMLVAIFWTFILEQSGHPELLYSNYLVSNKNACSKDNSSFKCNIKDSQTNAMYDVYL